MRKGRRWRWKPLPQHPPLLPTGTKDSGGGGAGVGGEATAFSPVYLPDARSEKWGHRPSEMTMGGENEGKREGGAEKLIKQRVAEACAHRGERKEPLQGLPGEES